MGSCQYLIQKNEAGVFIQDLRGNARRLDPICLKRYLNIINKYVIFSRVRFVLVAGIELLKEVVKYLGKCLGTILLIAGLGWAGPRSEIKFSHLTIEDNLSQSSIFCLLQDSRGFMWFGTEDGLNKYDGYNFKIFRPVPGEPGSVSYNYIKALYEDDKGFLWVGTFGGGFDRFDKDSDQFSHFIFKVDDPNSLSNNYVNTLIGSQSGLLWIGTENGLNRFNSESGEFTRYYHISDDPHSLSSSRITWLYEDQSGELWVGTDRGLNHWEEQTNRFLRINTTGSSPLNLSNDRITHIFEDRLGDLWVGTEEGLNRIDPQRKHIQQYYADSSDPHSLSHNYIYSIYEDKYDVLWIGTLSGLNRLDRETGRFQRFFSEIYNPESLSNNEILSMYEDRSGVFWIGTHIGLNIFDQERKPFFHYQAKVDDLNSLNYDYVYSIWEDSSGVLWFGTYGGGLNKYNRETGRFTHYNHQPENPHSLSNDYVRAIYEDRTGVLWVGTFGGGLDRFDRDAERFSHYRHRPDDPGSICSDFIRCILEDSLGILWIGTIEGLNAFDCNSQRFTSYKYNSDDPSSLSNNYIYALFEDHAGNLWIGTVEGLNRYDRQQDCFTHFFHDRDNPGSLSNSEVLSLYEDSQGHLWVGTPVGLNKFNLENNIFNSYSISDGLPNEVIYSIIEDRRGNLWISTNKGISRFNPRTEEFKNYDVRDGLQSNEFSLGAHFSREDGEMFFGGIHGVTAFYPEEIKDNPYVPPVVLTDFQIFNRSVPIGPHESGKNSVLKKSITETREIELSYNQNVISFEFAALHYASPEKNQYKYIMEGFDRDWNEVGNRRFATYTNLPYGDYTFRVLGSNNDGVWNEKGISLEIRVTPPFWQTLWFKVIVILCGLLLVVVLHQVRTRNIRARNIELGERVEERTAALRQEVNERRKAEQSAQEEIVVRKQVEGKIKAALQEKEVLLKEIHHRVKNNLQIISSLLRLQSSQIRDDETLRMFKDSQDRIKSMALIHETLYQSEDLSRIPFLNYLQRLTTHLISIYRSDSRISDINLRVDGVFLDINQAIPCGLIINELITNALKHAFPKGVDGNIYIKMYSDELGKCTLVIGDTGIGFPAGLDFRETETLGLQLVTGLVSQLEGEIELKEGAQTGAGANTGTEFTIRFRCR